jgi:hypothetical protein
VVHIDEFSLHRELDSVGVMAGQLRHLLEVAAMPAATVQILPAVAYPVNASGFLMADDAVWIEHAAGGFVYTEKEVVSGIALRFDWLRREYWSRYGTPPKRDGWTLAFGSEAWTTFVTSLR